MDANQKHFLMRLKAITDQLMHFSMKLKALIAHMYFSIKFQGNDCESNAFSTRLRVMTAHQVHFSMKLKFIAAHQMHLITLPKLNQFCCCKTVI